MIYSKGHLDFVHFETDHVDPWAILELILFDHIDFVSVRNLLELLNHLKGIKMVLISNSDIFSLTKNVQILARIYGYWSFSIDPKLSHVQTHPINYIWFALVLAVYAIATYTEFISFKIFLTENGSSIQVILQTITLSGEAGLTFISLTLDMLNRKFIWKIIIMLFAFDDEVS